MTVYFNPPVPTGWVCPRCGTANAPTSAQCPCSGTVSVMYTTGTANTLPAAGEVHYMEFLPNGSGVWTLPCAVSSQFRTVDKARVTCPRCKVHLRIQEKKEEG